MKILRSIAWFFLLPGFILINYLFNKLIQIQHLDNLHHYIFYLRAPLISGLLLILFPLIARKMIPSLLRNLFVMSKGYQVAMGVFAALVAGRAIIVAISAILENAPARFSIEPMLTIVFPYDYLGLAVLGFPIIHGIISETKAESQWWPKEGIAEEHKQKYDEEIIENQELYSSVAVGLSMSCAMFAIEGAVFEILKLLSPFFTTASTCLSKITNGLIDFTDGYIDIKTKLLSNSHLSSIALFITGCFLFWIFYYWFSPFSRRMSSQWEAPVLIYISATFSLLVTWFEGINFYFDKFNFPVFLSFILFSALSYLIWGVDHFFELSKEENIDNISPVPDDFYTAINQRLSHQDNNHPRTLVIVTASGGGIHAAGWTAQVLTGLQELLGPAFTKSIGFISGVSGGSVGTMYFLDKCGTNGYPEENLSVIVQNAVQDGLDAVGWGLVYRDLWRFIGLPWTLNKYEDRGTAIEKNWQGCMDKPDTKFSDWREKAIAGKIPIPVFNATLIEDGRRLLLSPMTFAKRDEEADRTIDFNTLYQEKKGQRYDIKVVTAARLSATFPYVSPSPRNSPDIAIERNYHIADGGYFDNSGVVTAIEWLENNMDIIIKKLNIEKLVFIEIEAQETPELPKKVNSNCGWFITLFGAIQALFSVRDASLQLRNQQEIDLLVKHYRSKLDGINPKSDSDSNVQYLKIEFPRRSKFRKEEPDGQGKEYTQPLSWKLTASQKYALEEAWQGIIPNHANPYPALANLQRLWHGDWGFPAPAINQTGGKHRTSDN
jgi:hypothetical protein